MSLTYAPRFKVDVTPTKIIAYPHQTVTINVTVTEINGVDGSFTLQIIDPSGTIIEEITDSLLANSSKTYAVTIKPINDTITIRVINNIDEFIDDEARVTIIIKDPFIDILKTMLILYTLKGGRENIEKIINTLLNYIILTRMFFSK